MAVNEGQSETMSTLHALRNKGVKVDLGIPDEMWDDTPAEITKLRLKVEQSLSCYCSMSSGIVIWHQKRSCRDVGVFRSALLASRSIDGDGRIDG